jgi:putative ABC transport system substrate-binding protein
MQSDRLKRREFVALLGGAAIAWPLAARAQQPAMPVIGCLSYASAEYDTAELLAAFRQGLGEIGYVEGQNVSIEYRWAEFKYERLAPMAADLVRHSVTAIVALGGTTPALVARRRPRRFRLFSTSALTRWNLALLPASIAPAET